MPDVDWWIVAAVAVISGIVVVVVILLVDYKGANSIVLSWLPVSLAATVFVQYYGVDENVRKESLKQFLKSAFATFLVAGGVVWTFYIGIMNKKVNTKPKIPMWVIVAAVVLLLMFTVSIIAQPDVNMVWSFIAGLFGIVMILYFFKWSPPLELEKSASTELYILLKKTNSQKNCTMCLGKKDELTEKIRKIKSGDDDIRNLLPAGMNIVDFAKAESLIKKIKKPVVESCLKIIGAFCGTFVYTFIPPLLTHFELHVWAGIVSNTPKIIIIVMLWEWNTPPPIVNKQRSSRAPDNLNFNISAVPATDEPIDNNDIELKFELVEYLLFCAYSILITTVFLSIVWFNEIESMSDDFIRVGSTAFGMTVLIIIAMLVPLVYPSFCKCAEWAKVEHPKMFATIYRPSDTNGQMKTEEEESLLGLKF